MSDLSASDKAGSNAGTGAVEGGRYSTVGRLSKNPGALPISGTFDVPERFGYKMKNKLLGRPLVTESLGNERLGKPTALAVLSSDVMSSSAYATEQLLVVLIPVIGLAAYHLVLPITAAILVVLAFVTASYLQVIKAFPKAGGAYVVTRETFGLKFAQLAAASLLIDYTLTVAVSVAAGTDALISAVPALGRYNVLIAVFFVALIAYGNLRGIREAGKSFAIPTFLFIINMGILIAVGLFRTVTGNIHAHSIVQSGAYHMKVHAGSPLSGLFYGASLFIVLQAFASGGTALTGTEAISNGVSIFRNPQEKNARKTLVAMSLILGTMFLGVSFLATVTHAVPRVSGSPTLVAQIATYVYGPGIVGRILYFLLQASTTMILVLAANTSFTGFPFLASFTAGDSFLPRQFTKRGHRLVFSNGIIVLTILAEILLIVTRAQVTALIYMYAIGVFTGFTMAGAGMVKHHLVVKEQGYRWRVVVNGSAAVLSFLVDVIFAVTKFKGGAWVVIVLMPILVIVFIRLHHQYVEEEDELDSGVVAACEAPILRKHVVIVLIDRLDLAAARSIQYGRAINPDELRAVHFVLDQKKTEELEDEWIQRGLGRIELEVIECPDRRLRRAALELVSEISADGETEVTVLLPRRGYARFWSRVLHDRTADSIAEVISQIPHVNATIIPFQLGMTESRRVRFRPKKVQSQSEASKVEYASATLTEDVNSPAFGAVPIGTVGYRTRSKVMGRVKLVKVQSLDSVPSFTARLEDQTGGLLLVFAGRKTVPGIVPGRRVAAEGMVGDVGGHLAMLNPNYEFLPGPDDEAD
ncbi:MAG: amino acid permease [Acidimicrobiaceae bacterium]|nr:amino acid permease [Acidimicrobiaceae bacterium]